MPTDTLCLQCHTSLISHGLVSSIYSIEYLCCGYCKAIYQFAIQGHGQQVKVVTKALNFSRDEVQKLVVQGYWTPLKELIRLSNKQLSHTEVDTLTSLSIGTAYSLDEWKKIISESPTVSAFLRRLEQK